jgi:hypothetical protein
MNEQGNEKCAYRGSISNTITVYDTEMALHLRMSGDFKEWKILFENGNGNYLGDGQANGRIILNWNLQRQVSRTRTGIY